MTNNQREILFRGFHLCEGGDTTIYVEGEAVKGRWVEGLPSYIAIPCSPCGGGMIEKAYTIAVEGFLFSLINIIVLPSTICPYTGLTDKNGRKAFVGDTVCYKCEYHTVNGVIRFGEIPDSNGRFKNIGYFIEWQDDGANTWGDWWRCDLGFWLEDEKCEVIGTIWDKGEL